MSLKSREDIMEAFRLLPEFWVCVEWTEDDPPISVMGPFTDRTTAYYQARYFRQSGLWAASVSAAYVVGSGLPRKEE